MKLSELKEKVDSAIKAAIEYGDTPEEILVVIQIDYSNGESIGSDDVKLHYDNDCRALGCVLVGKFGWAERSGQKELSCDHLHRMFDDKDALCWVCGKPFNPNF